MNPTNSLHSSWIFPRRLRVLTGHLDALILRNASVLDVGCGSGEIAKGLLALHPGISLSGVEIAPRPGCAIPVKAFDGIHLPYPDKSFSTVMLVDVLHHASDPIALLKDCSRVSSGQVLIKDHFEEGLLARPTLKLMDWVGNHRYGIPLPDRYWRESEWTKAWDEAGLRVAELKRRLGLYPLGVNWIFERSLHFIADLRVK